MARTMHKVNFWPQVSDEVKAHAISLVIGRYFTTPTLISRFGLDDWLAMIAVFIECETRKILDSYGERLPEIPVRRADPILAEDLIRWWKNDASIRARFPAFLDYVESVERAIEQGFSIDSKDS